MVLGVFGGLRPGELLDLQWKHIQLEKKADGTEFLYVDYKNDTKTNKKGEGFQFIVMPSSNVSTCGVNVFKRFVQFNKTKKCHQGPLKGRVWKQVRERGDGRYYVSTQNRGKSWVSKSGIRIATYLHLETPGKYTGHCFRRTCKYN